MNDIKAYLVTNWWQLWLHWRQWQISRVPEVVHWRRSWWLYSVWDNTLRTVLVTVQQSTPTLEAGGNTLHSPEARCPARRMLVNAREWRNNASWSSVAYTTSGSKARSNARWPGRSLAFKTRWRMCFSYKSFTFICFHANFSSFKTDKTRTAVKVIYLLIKKMFRGVYIFPCTLNGDIPYFLLQSAVADDVGHLIFPLCHEQL